MTLIRKPLPRTRATPRRRLPGCMIQRCKRSPYRRGECNNLCVIHLRQYLDSRARLRCLDEWGLFCKAEGYRNTSCTADSGTPSVQWAHIVRRGRGLTRRISGNAIPLCGRHHTYFTNNPEAWTLFVDQLIGVEAHRELMRRSLADEQLDLQAEWDALAAIATTEGAE